MKLLLAALALVALATAAHAKIVTYKMLASGEMRSSSSRSPMEMPTDVPDYTLHLLDRNKYPNALCLDGSMGGYYFRPALTADGQRKFRIFFEGGGWCTSDLDCYGRSQTNLGTTNGLNATSPEPSGYCGSSFLSANPTQSPGFYDWNAIYVPYCDGSSFTARNSSVISINSTATVHYKGAWIRDALFDDFASVGMDNATEVVVGGCSAGGVTIYLNMDPIRAMLPERAKVVGLADAGYLLDEPTYTGVPLRAQAFQWAIQAWNASGSVNQGCIANYPDATWKCMFAPYTIPFAKTPIFLVNTAFDSCQLNGCELNLPDVLNGWSKMSPMSQNLSIAYSKKFLAGVAPMVESPALHGGWIDMCLLHCQAGVDNWWHTKVMENVHQMPTSPAIAFQTWYNGAYNGTATSQRWWMDGICDTPPCNWTC